jgi:hypothetical protein
MRGPAAWQRGGQEGAERAVEARGELVEAVVARARGMERPHPRHAADQPHVDDPEPPRAHLANLAHFARVGQA